MYLTSAQSMINKASKSKPKKAKKKKGRADSDLEEDLDGDVGPVTEPVDTRVDPDDEWPEEDVKPKKGKKGKKGGAKKQVDEDEVEEATPTTLAPDTAVNMDDEWPEEDARQKKGKKGKKGKKQDDEDDVEPTEAAAPTPAPATEVNMDDEWPEEDVKKSKKEASAPASAPEAEADAGGSQDERDDGPKILTKKEKEKLKKEREKAKKKAQAAGKKAAGNTSTSQPQATTEAAPPVSSGAALPKGKKVPAHIAAMRAAMHEKARIEEEIRKAEEERLRKIEEEEARQAAEEQRIADQKAAKKQKEKEKQAKLKAEGKLLTPAQKREREIAEQKKQAMLASGMIVAGLQGGASTERKKPVYGKKKGKGPVKPAATKEEPETPQPAAPASSAAAAAPEEDDEEDDWAQEEKDTAEVDDLVNGVGKVKIDDVDDWDQSEDEVKPEPKVAAPTKTAPSSTPVLTNGTDKAPAKAPAKPANGKAPAADESSSEEESDDDDSSEEDSEDEFENRKEEALARIMERRRTYIEGEMRDPISVMLGHVDHGKTLLLDSIRKSSVAAGEAGGITQQIGSTYVPRDALIEKTARVNKDNELDIKTGLLILDTPGHASFSNLRSRGSRMTDISILVVDITQGFEPTTLEALNLLKKERIPFIVAVNKVDRLYGWKAIPGAGFMETFETQAKNTKQEFQDRVQRIKLAFSEQGLNSELFYQNTSMARNVSLVPVSAMTGEGLPDLLYILSKLAQERLADKLRFSEELTATVLEKKVVEGLGVTLDVIISNGTLRENDRIVLCGTDGPIATNVRAILSPQPLKEIRLKNQWIHLKEARASLGVKVVAVDLEQAIGGAKLYAIRGKEDVEAEEAVYKEMALSDLSDLRRYASKGPGIYVSASTLGSLEALLSFLSDEKIKVRDFGIGTIGKKAVRSAARMVDSHPDSAIIMAFDVEIDPIAKAEAASAGVTIFSEDVIYHLLDKFMAFKREFDESKRQAALPNAVWPVRLHILQAFTHRDPLVLGVEIIEGTLRKGTPLGVVRAGKDGGAREIISLGKVVSIEVNHKPVTNEFVRRQHIGAGAAIKIEKAVHESSKLYGRHFTDKDEVVSLISRSSIDTLKANFREQVDKGDWLIIKQMKTEQGIP
ncbi:hypothetical protein BD324DRAFT_614592 [Kockovaella imperatae]|uniref:Tr-type G domain-containing protein n=1 Tax=Kockovaella imperatae TaxID=4999 RepID=A0A1Y1UQA7_9TREE|nr:hypothetical protein BD324DRAFT_614592 [Kockovaella imperatae]ORX39684.1 hypothetical protein BD324DRAFT_614592 [Kockovaella imperatae]